MTASSYFTPVSAISLKVLSIQNGRVTYYFKRGEATAVNGDVDIQAFRDRTYLKECNKNCVSVDRTAAVNRKDGIDVTPRSFRSLGRSIGKKVAEDLTKTLRLKPKRRAKRRLPSYTKILNRRD